MNRAASLRASMSCEPPAVAECIARRDDRIALVSFLAALAKFNKFSQNSLPDLNFNLKPVRLIEFVWSAIRTRSKLTCATRGCDQESATKLESVNVP